MKVRKILREIASFTLFILSWLVPKQKNRILFLPRHSKGEFSGNLKPLFLHAYSESTYANLTCIWITDKQHIADDLSKAGFNVTLSTRRPIWQLLRADWIFLDAGQDGKYLRGNFKVVQVWHGTGFKKLGKLDTINTPRPWLGFDFVNWKLVLAGSAEDKKRKELCFPGAHVEITGSPRNDYFFTPDETSIHDELEIPLGKRIITYAPTWRDNNSAKAFSSNLWKHISHLMHETNSIFIIKRHPYDNVLTVPAGFEHILDLTHKVKDVQKLLKITDILISDYSGIITDYAITKRPIINYMYDYDAYIAQCREFYYDLKSILPGYICQTEEELLTAIADLSWFETPKYTSQYAKFLDMFHLYFDGESTKRTWETFLKLHQNQLRT